MREYVFDTTVLSNLAAESVDEYRLRSEFDLLLDPGEAACLALAIARGLVLATDDLAARRLAKCKGVDLTGTVGILIALVRDGKLALEDANTILTAMIQRGYRAPAERLDALV